MRKLVSAQWLEENRDNPKVVILDASMVLRADGTPSNALEETIPSARRFDLEKVFLDRESPYPNTFPRPAHFALECRKLGIDNDSEILVFDHRGVYASPRAWWLFPAMGHKKVAVLDGGLPGWKENGWKTEKGWHHKVKRGSFKADDKGDLLVPFEQIEKNVHEKHFLLVDARSQGRYKGVANEPRKHLKSGNIPHSVSIPYPEVLHKGRYRPKEELRALFAERCRGEKELVCSCGSGVSACIVLVACQISGYTNSKKVYDGSWTEWAERNNLKKEIQ